MLSSDFTYSIILHKNLTGFSDKQIDNLLANFNTAEVREENFDPVAAAAQIGQPITKPGDIWQLDRHH